MNDSWLRGTDMNGRPSGYEPAKHTLSLDDLIALTVSRPSKTSDEPGVLDASWMPTDPYGETHSLSTLVSKGDIGEEL